LSEGSIKRVREFSEKIENRNKSLGVPQFCQKEKNAVESLRHEIMRFVMRPNSINFHRTYCPLHLDAVKTLDSLMSL
jgi:hypothetical protein